MGTIICNKCGKAINSDSAFCPFCGAPVKQVRRVFCKRCGKELNQDALFCPYCGMDRTATISVNTVSQQRTDRIPSPQVQPAEEEIEEYEEESLLSKIFGFIGKLILALVLVAALLLGLTYLLPGPANKVLGNTLPIELPFGYQLDLPWLAKARNDRTDYDSPGSSSAYNSGSETESSTYTVDNSDTSSQSDNVFENALAHYVGKNNPDPSDYSGITSLSVNGNRISLNMNTMGGNSEKTGSIDLSQLSIFPNLRELYITNTKIEFPSGVQDSLTEINISNCTIGDSAAGIENFVNLQKVHITNTDLTDLTKIASLRSLKELDAPNNQITDTYALENCSSLSKAVLYGNNIWDYRGLRNVKTVDIWNNNGSKNNIGSSTQYPSGYQIQVTVSDLRIRTSPNAKSKTNMTGDCVEENYYYYVLDEYWDSTLNTTWYKIGNDMWIAGGDNGRSYTRVV